MRGLRFSFWPFTPSRRRGILIQTGAAEHQTLWGADMGGWFTVESIDKDTYAISEYKHWEETHCYLLCGRRRAVLIDTGLGVDNIRAAVDALTRLPVTVITTHAHWDHIGGHRYFPHIEVHEAERDWLAERFPLPPQVVRRNLTAKPCDFPKGFDPEAYQVFHGTPAAVFTDGDTFDLGGRLLTVIHTPGHSPGHCCFYEPQRGYLYAGDLIYLGCLDAFYPTTDPELFCRSVKRVKTLDVGRILPGHHQLAVPADTIERVAGAFDEIEKSGKLVQGAGLFPFGDFQIHL